MKSTSLFIGVALLALMAGALLYTAQQKADRTLDGKPIVTDAVAPPAELEVVTHPAFTLPDMEGEPREFAEWDGKYRIVNFWATWCAPCRREIPLLKEFQAKHAESDIQVIGVAVDFPEAVNTYAENAQFNYPILVGQEDAMAIAEGSGVPFIGMPFTMIVTADGELIDTHIGEIFEENLVELEEIFAELRSGAITVEQARELM